MPSPFAWDLGAGSYILRAPNGEVYRSPAILGSADAALIGTASFRGILRDSRPGRYTLKTTVLNGSGVLAVDDVDISTNNGRSDQAVDVFRAPGQALEFDYAITMMEGRFPGTIGFEWNFDPNVQKIPIIPVDLFSRTLKGGDNNVNLILWNRDGVFLMHQEGTPNPFRMNLGTGAIYNAAYKAFVGTVSYRGILRDLRPGTYTLKCTALEGIGFLEVAGVEGSTAISGVRDFRFLFKGE